MLNPVRVDPTIGIIMFSEDLISRIRVNNIVLFFLYGLDVYGDIDE